MERRDEDNLICIEPQIPHDWARLIRKLRWIGRESRAPGIGGEHFTPSREVRRIFRTLQHRLEADARDDTRRIHSAILLGRGARNAVAARPVTRETYSTSA